MSKRERAASLRIGLTQWRPTRDIAANLATATDLVAAAGPGADLVLLPENGLMLGSNTEMREAALAVDSPEIDELRAAAETARTAVVLGGFKHRTDDGRITNTALVIGSDGEIAGSYDKIHLFDARIAGTSFEASSVEQPGARPVIVEIEGVRVGLSICYDVRFPELYRGLALAGAEVILVPAAFTHTTGKAHWEVLLRARAIESAAFVVASATIRGTDGTDAFETYGHALAVDPWGEVLADLGEAAPAWQVLELPLAEVHQVRDRLPVLRGVRPEATGAPPEIIPVR
ncbi:carbon-nitrogen hydrolase family protein [Pseudonocardia petroleophila]|uniref:Carbon-nitrogen hydrolase n=1 Tax=Pseudonocardia petroleophila TaxID=37331 RepID=A0A7G7MKJ7_9PSEU|nr:nitrilase-related carbon-nitrogen hydrolase [Pseudonocardia petroleophila]QNG53308.1 carbon-nitrogen hydrolase [Pseudonocardia petroleophila]